MNERMYRWTDRKKVGHTSRLMNDGIDGQTDRYFERDGRTERQIIQKFG
jgi:hypothetical protein